MVALLTPDSRATASILVPSTPCSATSSSAAFSTFWWALALRVRGISDLDFRKEIASDTQQHERNQDQDGTIGGKSEMRTADQRASQAIDPVGQRVHGGDHPEHPRQVVERVEGSGEKEDRHDQKIHDQLKALDVLNGRADR